LRQAGAARGVACNAKANKVDREDPEYKAVLARQQVLTEAMDVLTKYDEAQTDFQALYADSNAPLGDWCGYYTRLTADKRETMRDSCRALASEASYVLIGLNAGNLVEARNAMGQWITGLGLPEPDRVPFTDDTLRQEYDAIDEMPDELQELFSGPIHMCYNSIAGADEDTGDDAGFPPAAHAMPYPAGDRGVVFTPILEGFFTQYGDIPLDLFDKEADALAPTPEEVATEVAARSVPGDPDIATKQQAALGNPMAAKTLADKQRAASAQTPDYGMSPPSKKMLWIKAGGDQTGGFSGNRVTGG